MAVNPEYGIDLGNFKPFTRNEWLGYAGAEKIKIVKQVDPLIYYGDNYEVIISASGDQNIVVDVFAGDDDEEFMLVYNEPLESVIKRISRVVKSLDAADDDEELIDTLKDFGFKQGADI